MLKRLVLAALLCAGAAQADELNGGSFTVSFDPSIIGAGEAPVVDAGKLVWDVNLRAYQGTAPFDRAPFEMALGYFYFFAAPGLQITGYEITYAVSFWTDTHTFVGTEFPPYPTGYFASNDGWFDTSLGTVLHFTSSFHGSFLVGETFLGAVFPDLQASVHAPASIGPFCLDGSSPTCEQDTIQLASETLLSTMTIRPLFAAPVPEPSTYALLGAGLLALAWRRRQAKAPS